MDSEWIWVFRGLYVASFILLINGLAEFFGGMIKNQEKKDLIKLAPAIIKGIAGLIFLVIAGVFILTNAYNK